MKETDSQKSIKKKAFSQDEGDEGDEVSGMQCDGSSDSIP